MHFKRLLVERMCEINPVTNMQGKGRNDFKVEMLLKAEAAIGMPGASQAVKKLGEQVKNTFHLFRMLIRKYGENIEVVDPMLRNNQELADVMGDLERAWALAKDQMVEEERLNHLQAMSSYIESSAGKYKAFGEMIEACDSDMFIAVPCLPILKCLTAVNDNSEETGGTGICKRFLPTMFKEGEEPHHKYAELKSEYLKLKARVCGNTEFIIKRGNSSHGARQRS